MAETATIAIVPVPAHRKRAGVVRKLLRVPRASLGVAILLIVLFCAIFAAVISPYDPEEMDFGALLTGMSWDHWFGTDRLGRDTLSRLIYGSQIALIVSVGAISFACVVGVPLGLISVYFRGWVDDLFMRFTDALTVFPSLLIAVALAATLGSSLWTVILAIGLANIPWIARIVRSQGLSIREQDYVAAAIAGGMSHLRVIFKHIFPNTLAPVIVQATLGMGYAVLVEAALGFIGVGVQPPTSTWGNMLQQAFPVLEQQPLMSVVPGVAIFLLVLAFNFVGDTLRDILDPRLRGVLH